MDLTKLGLTKSEEKVYLTLIKLGKSTASIISRESDVSYGKIYNVLDSLERKGLIQIVPEETKKFVASDPRVLLKIIEKEKQNMKKLESEVKNLKKIYELKEGEIVKIARGKRNFYKIEREIPKSKTYEYNIKYNVEYNPVWEREYKKYIKNKVKLKELVRMDKETFKNIKRWLKVHRNIKEIPNEGVAISIRDDSVILVALIKSNISILIKDKAFVKLMKILFEAYYEKANRVSFQSNIN